jgi:hypothetical protein
LTLLVCARLAAHGFGAGAICWSEASRHQRENVSATRSHVKRHMIRIELKHRARRP